MKILVPQKFQKSMLANTNLSETVAAWSSSTTYPEDSQVSFPDSSGIIKIYQSLRSTVEEPNLNNSPSQADSDWWFEMKTGNTYAMFDGTVNNQSIASGTVTIQLSLENGISGLCLVNSDFGSISIDLQGFGGSLYRKTYEKPSINQDVDEWYKYYNFKYVSPDLPTIFTDLVNVKGSSVSITLTPNPETGYVKIGELLFGTIFELGYTQRPVTAGIVDYSVKQVDDFGNIRFIERAYSKKFNCKVLTNNKILNAAQRVLYDLRARPAIWIAAEDSDIAEATIIYGFYKDFSAELTYPDYSVYTLEIEGLI